MANRENASETTPLPKRARIDPTTTLPRSRPSIGTTEKASRPLPPKGLADAFVRSHIATLHPEVSSLIEQLASTYLDLKTKAHNKRMQLKKMTANKEFFPRSTRFDFQFYVSDDVKKTTAFDTLQTATQKEINDFKVKLKSRVIEAIQLELAHLDQQAIDHFPHALRHITKTFLVVDRATTDNLPVDQTVKEVASELPTIFLRDLSIPTVNSLLESYNKFHGVGLSPLSQQDSDNDDTMDDSITMMDPAFRAYVTQPATSRRSSSVAKTIASTINATFYLSWLQFEDQYARNQVTVQLRKLAVEALDTPATAAASAIIDNQPPVEASTVNDLVASATRQHTKTLESKIRQLESRLASLSKNSNPRSRHRSSSKQNIGQQPQRNKSPNRRSKSPNNRNRNRNRNQNANRKADASANDSTGVNSNRNDNKLPMHGRKKPPSSNANSNKRRPKPKPKLT